MGEFQPWANHTTVDAPCSILPGPAQAMPHTRVRESWSQHYECAYARATAAWCYAGRELL